MRFYRHLARVFSVLAAWVLPAWTVSGAVASRLPESALVAGMAAGGASKSYQQLTLHEAIDQIRQAGARVAEIHFGQPLSPAERQVSLNDAMTDEQLAGLRRKLGASGVRLAAARVRFSNNQSANQRLFEWAARLDIQVLVGDVPNEQFDSVEKLIRKFNISVALPTGPRAFGGPQASWTDPKGLMATLRGRDPRFGVVINVLSLVKAGVDPFQAVVDLRTRLHGIQVSDYRPGGAQARAVPFGEGLVDFRRFLALLDAQRFDGYLVFEWPAEDQDFRGDLAKGLDFLRTEMTAVRRSNLLKLASREASARPGLSYEVLVQGEMSEPVSVRVAPDGTCWLAGRRGDFWTWRAGMKTNAYAGRVPVSVTGQRGIYGMAFDPGFSTNGYLYVYRAPMLSTGNSNRVARFTVTADEPGRGPSVSIPSERVLLDIPSEVHGRMQGGGFLLHPVDGCLYIGTGDNNRPEETPRFFDDPLSNAQNLGELRGKILRIRPDGTVPADNPFVTTQGARPEIYAYGLRNPFTLSVDSGTGRVYVGDVGYDRREDWEEIDVLKAGGNYGWPRCDGRNRDTLAAVPCPLSDVVAPWFGYPHESASSVLVGPFVSDGPPPGWPEAFSHGLLYADFSRRVVRFAQVDRVRNVVTNTLPVVSGLAGGPVGMALTPSGELMLVEYAGWLAAHHLDRLSRLRPEKAGRTGGESVGGGAVEAGGTNMVPAADAVRGPGSVR